ncbi:hypothetical protein ACFQVA_05640 [Actinomadura keratinilytica]
MSAPEERELLLVGVGFMGRPYAAAAKRLGLRVRAIEAHDWAGAIEHLVDAVEPSQGRYGALDELWAETVHAAVEKSRRPASSGSPSRTSWAPPWPRTASDCPAPPSRRP